MFLGVVLVNHGQANDILSLAISLHNLLNVVCERTNLLVQLFDPLYAHLSLPILLSQLLFPAFNFLFHLFEGLLLDFPHMLEIDQLFFETLDLLLFRLETGFHLLCSVTQYVFSLLQIVDDEFLFVQFYLFSL